MEVDGNNTNEEISVELDCALKSYYPKEDITFIKVEQTDELEIIESECLMELNAPQPSISEASRPNKIKAKRPLMVVDDSFDPGEQFYSRLFGLEKDAFNKYVQLHCKTEDNVVKLRSHLVLRISHIDDHALKAPLPPRPNTKRVTSLSRYLDDCFALQRFIDGRTSVINFDTSPIVPKTPTTKSTKTVNKSIRQPNKTESDDKVLKLKQRLRKERVINTKKSEKLSNRINFLKTELKDLKTLVKRLSSGQNNDCDIDYSQNTENIIGEEVIEELKSEPNADDDVTYEIKEGATQRRGPTLVSSNGFTYIIKRKIPNMVIWRCRVRVPTYGCSAHVYQKGDTFKTGSRGHNHSADPRIKREYGQVVKEEDVQAYISEMSEAIYSVRKPTFSCFECEKKFVYRKLLEEHCNEVHGSRYRCFPCNRTFSNYNSYKEHLVVIHTDVKPFSCDVCDKRFHLQKTLRKHAKSHMPKVRNRICEDCGKGFHSTDTLKKHLKVHADPCFLCIHCGKMFKTKQNLREHVNSHTREVLFQCVYCSRQFTHSTHMRLHIRRLHTGERPYKCSFCEKGFVCSSERKSHERIHTGQGGRKKNPDSRRQQKRIKLLNQNTKQSTKNSESKNNSVQASRVLDLEIPVDHCEEVSDSSCDSQDDGT